MKTLEFNPFLPHCNLLQELLDKASRQKNPSLWLFQNDVRTLFFMLEGLTRIHDRAFDEKLFSKWHKNFKKLEDVFGEIDYYNWLQNDFKTNKKIEEDVVLFFAERSKKVLEKNDNRLLKKAWFENKLNGFTSKLSEYTVEYNKEYLNELKTVIQDEIEVLNIFTLKIDCSFTKFEEEVHEFRRKLRWISIYAQALSGLIQLKKSTKKARTQIDYFTKEIIQSPFNKLPSKPKSTAILEFDHDSFFALSWMINELGKCKDKGLRIIALADSIFRTQDITHHQAKLKALQILGLKENTEELLLKEISEKVKIFMTKDKILDKLLVK